MRELEKQKELDREFAREMNRRIQNELEEEKIRAEEQKRIYYEAIKNQKEDKERQRAQERENEQRENELLKQAMNDNRDLLERLNSDNQKKQDFIASLKDQIRQKEMLRRRN